MKQALIGLRHSKGFNWLVLAFILIAVGATLNQIVIRLNGGMPVIGLDEPVGKWVPYTSATHLSFLSDLVPVGNATLSLGDMISYMGFPVYLFGFVLWFMDRRKEKLDEKDIRVRIFSRT